MNPPSPSPTPPPSQHHKRRSHGHRSTPFPKPHHWPHPLSPYYPSFYWRVSSSLQQNYSTATTLGLSAKITTQGDPNLFIPLSPEDKSRLYAPWKHAVIVKVFGHKVGHQILRQKIYAQWKPTKNLPLIDLGSDFFLIKFQKEENMQRALQQGPWFVLNLFFLSVNGHQNSYPLKWSSNILQFSCAYLNCLHNFMIYKSYRKFEIKLANS